MKRTSINSKQKISLKNGQRFSVLEFIRHVPVYYQTGPAAHQSGQPEKLNLISHYFLEGIRVGEWDRNNPRRLPAPGRNSRLIPHSVLSAGRKGIKNIY